MILKYFLLLPVTFATCYAFTVYQQCFYKSSLIPIQQQQQLQKSSYSRFNRGCLFLSSRGSDSEYSDDQHGNVSNITNTLITKETFLKEILKDQSAVVKRKGKKNSNSNYKILDNRDSLPFAVELTTPDPYTHPEIKRQRASKYKVPRKAGGIESSTIASTLYLASGNNKDAKRQQNDSSDDDLYKTKLGEFMLDKHTTTGDILEVGQIQYKVIRHKCQYKYVGGKRFVMVRKVLQVKEIARLQTEEYLTRQFQSSGSCSSESDINI